MDWQDWQNCLEFVSQPLQNIKSSGILDPAISQHGKVIVIDADLALELMKAKQNASAVINNKTKFKNYGRRI